MVAPWLRAGYPCIIVDTEHPKGRTVEGLLTKVGSDVAHFQMPHGVYMAFAFPPCTHLANSGAHAYERKGPEVLKAAVDFVKLCWAKISLAQRYMLENPVGRLPKYWRKYNVIIQPYEYAGYIKSVDEAMTKKTCLWLGGRFILPKKRPIYPIKGSAVTDSMCGGSFKRSITPKGFAEAVFHANHIR
jgi:hypothetical protein